MGLFYKLAPLRDFVTFSYGVIFLFAMILNLLVNRLKTNSAMYVSCIMYGIILKPNLKAFCPHIFKLSNI